MKDQTPISATFTADSEFQGPSVEIRQMPTGKGNYILMCAFTNTLSVSLCRAPLNETRVDNTTVSGKYKLTLIFYHYFSDIKPSFMQDNRMLIAIIALVVGQCLQGLGDIAIFAVGKLYIDENVTQNASPMYLCECTFLHVSFICTHFSHLPVC
jgi:hypothetical protein